MNPVDEKIHIIVASLRNCVSPQNVNFARHASAINSENMNDTVHDDSIRWLLCVGLHGC